MSNSSKNTFLFLIGTGSDHISLPSLLHEICYERGWREYNDENVDDLNITNNSVDDRLILWWLYSNHPMKTLRSLTATQYTNHGDKSFIFTSKDSCTRYIRRLKNTYGDIFDFCPISFNLPSEYSKLCIEHTHRRALAFWQFWERTQYIGVPLIKQIDAEKQPIWIIKPVGKSQGKGIVVFDSVSNLSYTKKSVVQEYISRPHLIGEYKWDLRIYVCIISTNPLIIYAYREGLVRFATSPFSLKELNNVYGHLTNSSLNKLSPYYHKTKTPIGKGCKWNLARLRKYFDEKHIDDWYLWQRISAILILTIIGDGATISTFSTGVSCTAFHLLGFDIMVDRNFKPFLAEVNSNPSLNSDCEVDLLVKKPMLHELFDLLRLADKRKIDKSENESDDSGFCDNSTISSFKGTKISLSKSKKTQNYSERTSKSLKNKNYNAKKLQINKTSQDVKKGSNGASTANYNFVDLKKFCSITELSSSEGLWVKIFPFNKKTEKLSKGARVFDVKEVTSQIQQMLNIGDEIRKQHGSFYKNDEELIEKMKLTTEVWHP